MNRGTMMQSSRKQKLKPEKSLGSRPRVKKLIENFESVSHKATNNHKKLSSSSFSWNRLEQSAPFYSLPRTGKKSQCHSVSKSCVTITKESQQLQLTKHRKNITGSLSSFDIPQTFSAKRKITDEKSVFYSTSKEDDRVPKSTKNKRTPERRESGRFPSAARFLRSLGRNRGEELTTSEQSDGSNISRKNPQYHSEGKGLRKKSKSRDTSQTNQKERSQSFSDKDASRKFMLKCQSKDLTLSPDRSQENPYNIVPKCEQSDKIQPESDLNNTKIRKLTRDSGFEIGHCESDFTPINSKSDHSEGTGADQSSVTPIRISSANNCNVSSQRILEKCGVGLETDHNRHLRRTESLGKNSVLSKSCSSESITTLNATIGLAPATSTPVLSPALSLNANYLEEYSKNTSILSARSTPNLELEDDKMIQKRCAASSSSTDHRHEVAANCSLQTCSLSGRHHFINDSHSHRLHCGPVMSKRNPSSHASQASYDDVNAANNFFVNHTPSSLSSNSRSFCGESESQFEANSKSNADILSCYETAFPAQYDSCIQPHTNTIDCQVSNANRGLSRKYCDNSPPPPPVRDASSLKYIRYGPGHEKFPSWPVPASCANQVLCWNDGSSNNPSHFNDSSHFEYPMGCHRSHSWTEQSDYPKETSDYSRPRPKNPASSSFQEQLFHVMDDCEKISPDVFRSRPPEELLQNSNQYLAENFDSQNLTYFPLYDREGRTINDKDYNIPSPPERDDETAQCHVNRMTIAQLEEHVRLLNGDYSQATPMLYQLRQENYNWENGSERDSGRGESESVGDSCRFSGRDSVATVVTHSSSASSSETLKRHGSYSDLSLLSDQSREARTDSIVVHSAKVQTPKRQNSESVLYYNKNVHNKTPTKRSGLKGRLSSKSQTNLHSGSSRDLDYRNLVNNKRNFFLNSSNQQLSEISEISPSIECNESFMTNRVPKWSSADFSNLPSVADRIKALELHTKSDSSDTAATQRNYERQSDTSLHKQSFNTSRCHSTKTTDYSVPPSYNPIAPSLSGATRRPPNITHQTTVADNDNSFAEANESCKSYTYLDPEKKCMVSDFALKNIQKQALMSFYERKTGKSLHGRSQLVEKESPKGNQKCSLVQPNYEAGVAKIATIPQIQPLATNYETFSQSITYSPYTNDGCDRMPPELPEKPQQILDYTSPLRKSDDQIHRKFLESPYKRHRSYKLKADRSSDFNLMIPSLPILADEKPLKPPERPPKKPNLKSIFLAKQAFADYTQPVETKSGAKPYYYKKPPAPDPPSTPEIENPPSNPTSPEPPLPPPPVVICEQASLNDEPLPPPPDELTLPELSPRVSVSNFDEKCNTNEISLRSESPTNHLEESTATTNSHKNTDWSATHSNYVHDGASFSSYSETTVTSGSIPSTNTLSTRWRASFECIAPPKSTRPSLHRSFSLDESLRSFKNSRKVRLNSLTSASSLHVSDGSLSHDGPITAHPATVMEEESTIPLISCSQTAPSVSDEPCPVEFPDPVTNEEISNPIVLDFGRKTTLQELKCSQALDTFLSILSPTSALKEALGHTQSSKSSANFMQGVFLLDFKRDFLSASHFNHPDIQDQCTSNYSDSVPPNEEIEKSQFSKKETVIEAVLEKLCALRTEKQKILDEIFNNTKLGDEVSTVIRSIAKLSEIDKYNTHTSEIDKIANLLLGLSGRLARIENSIVALTPDASNEEKNLLIAKRDRLAEQFDEAKKIKQSIDKRALQVSNLLLQYLNEAQYVQYDHFIKMKAKLLMDSREVDDKMDLANQQLKILRTYL